MEDDPTKAWSDEKMFQHFVDQVRAVFFQENADWLKMELADIAAIRCSGREPPFAPRDSFMWEVFNSCEFSYLHNSVKVVLPTGFGITTDFLEMFDGTSVAWSVPFIEAAGDRVVVDVMLIDYWDDEREAAWQAVERPTRKSPWAEWIPAE